MATIVFCRLFNFSSLLIHSFWAHQYDSIGGLCQQILPNDMCRYSDWNRIRGHANLCYGSTYRTKQLSDYNKLSLWLWYRYYVAVSFYSHSLEAIIGTEMDTIHQKSLNCKTSWAYTLSTDSTTQNGANISGAGNKMLWRSSARIHADEDIKHGKWSKLPRPTQLWNYNNTISRRSEHFLQHLDITCLANILNQIRKWIPTLMSRRRPHFV